MKYGRCQILKEWPDWDYQIHTDKAQIERQGKAIYYPMDFIINQQQQTARFSSTSELPYYITSLSSCNCGDFKCRHLPCKHIYRLAIELGIIKIINRNPGGYDKGVLAKIYASDDMDNHPEQLKRIKSAQSPKTTPDSIDEEKQTGIFPGSGKQPYETTLHSCTCRDFVVRRLPCKHIYRLRMELGSMSRSINTGITTLDDVIIEIEKLPEELQFFIMQMLPLLSVDNPVGFYLNKNLQQIIDCPIFVFRAAQPFEIFNDMRKKDIIAFLDKLCVEPGQKLKRDDLISWCLKHIPNLSDKLPSKFYISCNPLFNKLTKKTENYLRKKFMQQSNTYLENKPIWKYQKYPE